MAEGLKCDACGHTIDTSESLSRLAMELGGIDWYTVSKWLEKTNNRAPLDIGLNALTIKCPKCGDVGRWAEI